MFPWVMVFARRIGTVRFACCSISFWLVSQASVTLLSYILQRNVSQWLIDLTFYFPASHLNSFLIGMTAALLTSKWAPPMWLAAFVAATSLITSGFLILHVPGLSRFNIVVEDGLPAPLFAAFVASIVKINSRVMRSRLSVLLGDISYAVYISQLAVMLILHKYLLLGSTPKNGCELSLFLAVLFIFSFLMYVTFRVASARGNQENVFTFGGLTRTGHFSDARPREVSVPSSSGNLAPQSAGASSGVGNFAAKRRLGVRQDIRLDQPPPPLGMQRSFVSPWYRIMLKRLSANASS